METSTSIFGNSLPLELATVAATYFSACLLIEWLPGKLR
jgi:hypothetical protein